MDIHDAFNLVLAITGVLILMKPFFQPSDRDEWNMMAAVVGTMLLIFALTTILPPAVPV